MFFQKRIERALKKEHEDAQLRGREQYEGTLRMNMEKGDMTAMVLAALITILPAVLLALGFLVAIGYFFLVR